MHYLHEVERKNKEKILFISQQAERWMNNADSAMKQGVALPWIITIILASAFLGLIVGLAVFFLCKGKQGPMEEAIVFD